MPSTFPARRLRLKAAAAALFLTCAAAPPASGQIAGGQACNASPLPVTGTRIVNVSSVTELQNAMGNLQSGDTIVLIPALIASESEIARMVEGVRAVLGRLG